MMEKLPLLALSLVDGIVTILAQRGTIQTIKSISLPLRLANAAVSCVEYLCQMIWPSGLAVYYPYPYRGLPAWEIVLAAMALAGFSALAWRQRGKQPWLLIGWLWYLVMLLPVAGLIQAGSQTRADRYTYLPQIGIVLAVTWLVAEWGAKSRAGRALLGSLMVAAVGALAVCAWQQTTYWQNTESIWTRAIHCTTGNDVAFNHLARAKYQKGKADEALLSFQQAVKINPEYADAHINLANLLLQRGQVDEAVSHLQRALEINPTYALAHNNLGNILQKQGQVDDAILHFQKALQVDPAYGMAHYNLGNALAQKGNAAEAISHFEKALQIQPDDSAAQNNLAWLLATSAESSLRNGREAVELARQASAATGGQNPIILHTLAAALAETGRFPEAAETAQRALSLAAAQSNGVLGGQLQAQLRLYQAGRPYHRPKSDR